MSPSKAAPSHGKLESARISSDNCQILENEEVELIWVLNYKPAGHGSDQWGH
jgi:hypothetical protein